MIKVFQWILCVMLSGFGSLAVAHEANVTLDLQNASLPDALRLFAKFLHKNIIVSPMVNGLINLHLQHEQAEAALNALLMTHNLALWKVNDMWYVAPRNEIIKKQQEEIKWQEVTVQAEPLQTQVWQIHYGKADDIVKTLQGQQVSLLSKRGHVSVDVRTNRICIQDVPSSLVVAHHLIQQLDIPIQQVLIEAHLVSVDNDFERELGINFAIVPAPVKNTFETGRYSMTYAKLTGGSWLDVQLAALEKMGHAKLISNPRLFTANQQTASIEAGEEIPYQEVSESGGTAVVFKKAVLRLKVTPQILPGNRVLLQMQINQDRPNNKMIQGMPTISTREILTNVLVKNGQTIVLGGIYETVQENGMQGLPFLGRLPWIGLLFSERRIVENKRQLLIFVTPKVMMQDL